MDGILLGGYPIVLGVVLSLVLLVRLLLACEEKVRVSYKIIGRGGIYFSKCGDSEYYIFEEMFVIFVKMYDLGKRRSINLFENFLAECSSVVNHFYRGYAFYFLDCVAYVVYFFFFWECE